MNRYAEAVLDGHPDRFCDVVAERLLQRVCNGAPDAFGQIEASVWNDRLFLTGTVVTEQPLTFDVSEVVKQAGYEIGYGPGNRIDAGKFQVTDHITRIVADPRRWTEHCNDQCVVVGYAGYDLRTRHLPPEQFAVWFFRTHLIRALKGAELNGYGPDGKILIVMQEYPSEWRLLKLLVTLQQPAHESFALFLEKTGAALRRIYSLLQQHDARWCAGWSSVEVLINPNGPLVEAGMCSDNGQTGRKLVMDYYGPRIPIGGGALHGKHRTHIDRLAAVEARRFCVKLVHRGAGEAMVRVAYAPGCDAPLDVTVESGVRPDVEVGEYFGFERMRRGGFLKCD